MKNKDQRFTCKTCGKNHPTWEHRLYEKVKALEAGKPISFLVIDEKPIRRKVFRLHSKEAK